MKILKKDKLILNDFSLDDLQKAVEQDKNIQMENKKMSHRTNNWFIKQKFAFLSNDANAPLFALVDWNGKLRYDIRYWYNDNKPGKGLTFTYKELNILYEALINFDFSRNIETIIRTYQIYQSTAKFYSLIAELSSFCANGIIWNKEANLIDWGYGKKIDLRKWSNDYKKCSKGICLNLDEMKILLDNIKMLR